MGRDDEAFMPQELVDKVLAAAGDDEDLILVGGQALGVWMSYYDIRYDGSIGPAVSRDVDFLTRSAANLHPLLRFARVIGGRTEVRNIRALTALIGSAVTPADDGKVYNVDLLHQVFEIPKEQVFNNASLIPVPNSSRQIRVMHPLDVMLSRCVNLHKLSEKQDDAGIHQYAMSVVVARTYLMDQFDRIEKNNALSDDERERAQLDQVAAVEKYVAKDAARKNAERYGVNMADSIPAFRVTSEMFWEKQWPYLRQHMSTGFAEECEADRLPRPGLR